MNNAICSTPWPLPVRKPQPDPAWAKVTEEFQSIGGDFVYLNWLHLGLSEESGPFLNSRQARQLAQQRDQFHALRQSLYKLALLKSFPELQRLELALVDAEMKLAMTLKFDKQRRQAALSRLRLGRPKGGHPVTRHGLYRWLGALVPYTAFCRGGKPWWAWIDRWLEYKKIEIPGGGCQKYWSDTVLGQWKKQRGIKPDLAVLLADAANQFPLYLSVMRKEMSPEEKRKATILEKRYDAVVRNRLTWTCV